MFHEGRGDLGIGALEKCNKCPDKCCLKQSEYLEALFFLLKSRFSSKASCVHFKIAAKFLNPFLFRRDDVREISNEAVTSAPTRASIK